MAEDAQDAEERAVRVRVEGRVQGVFYRASTRETARRLGLTGWVRNRADGTVEALFQGPAAAVGAAVDWCREGPPGAWVDRLSVDPETPDDQRSGFDIVG